MWSSAFCAAADLVEAGRMGRGVGGRARHLHWLSIADISCFCSLSFCHFHTSKNMIPQDVRERQEKHECLYAHGFTVKLLSGIESNEIVWRVKDLMQFKMSPHLFTVDLNRLRRFWISTQGSKPLASPGHPGIHLVAEVISALVFKWWTPVFWKNKKMFTGPSLEPSLKISEYWQARLFRTPTFAWANTVWWLPFCYWVHFLEGKSWVTRESGKEKSLLRAVHVPLFSLSPTREVHGVEDTILMGNSLALWSLGEYLSPYPVITLKIGLQNSSYSDSEAEKLTSLCVYTFCAKTRKRGLSMARCFMRPLVRNDPDPGSQALPHAGGSGLSLHGICSQGQMQNAVSGPAELSQRVQRTSCLMLPWVFRVNVHLCLGKSRK